ncbi:MAG TPA: trehalose-phosphatase [Thermoanaerobaculia bacterium]|nr:trehalose-phosphatase [Thermoanaerobaculia bacterium]
MSGDILRPVNRRVLAEFAASNVLLAFDFDGTLAPIVAEPSQARMRSETLRLLTEAASLYPCIVVSGRAQSDLVGRLDGVPVRGVVGNHGVEPWQASRALSDEVRRWHPQLERKLRGLPGVTIEDKSFSVSVHYRQARDKEKAREQILDAAAALGDVRVIGGIEVVNILPPGAPDKGTALVSERERLGCESAIYVGDDETDEDVFALEDPDRILGIRVGPTPASAAEYSIVSQVEIDALLRVLVELRRSKKTEVSR